MERCVRPRRVKSALCLLLSAFACSCQLGQRHEVPPLASPSLYVSAREYAGTPLSGELAQSIDASTAKQAWSVAARIIAVKQLPTSGFSGIGPLATLVLSDDAGNLMTPSSRLVYSTLYRTLEPGASLDPLLGDPKGWIQISTSRAAVAPGTAVSLEFAQPARAFAQSNRRQVNVEVFRQQGADGYTLAIISHDRVHVPAPQPTANSDPSAPPSAPPPQVVKEVQETVIVPQPKIAAQGRIVLAIPMDFAESDATGLIIDLTIDTKPTDAGAIAERLKADVDASAARVAEKTKHASANSDDLLIGAMFDSLAASGDAPRAPLVYLAQQLNAQLTESVVLVANDKVLSLIAKGVRDKFTSSSTHDRASMSWLLDRVTIQVVASIKDDETSHTLAAVQGALETYAGEAGRELDLLQSLANASVSSEDLYHHLIAEQLNDLDDSSPSTRVRAFDWLNSRGLAPADYDPMASAKLRRAALDKLDDAAATQP